MAVQRCPMTCIGKQRTLDVLETLADGVKAPEQRVALGDVDPSRLKVEAQLRSSTRASADPVALAVDAVHASGERIRHAPHRSDLLGRAATPTDGRWQHGELVPGLYLAEDAAAAVADSYRFLAELGIPRPRCPS